MTLQEFREINNRKNAPLGEIAWDIICDLDLNTDECYALYEVATEFNNIKCKFEARLYDVHLSAQ